jgi:glucokinase
MRLEYNNLALGIDIGGTKLAAGIVDQTGHRYSYLVKPTPPTDAEGLLNCIVDLARQAITESGGLQPFAAGVGCGGPMEYPAGIVSPLHIPAWKAFPLRARLGQALGLPTIVDNDAKALALGEALFGAGRGARCLLGMVASTGVGGGIVAGGRLWHGASGNAGHIGHVIVASQGEQCECGAQGCLTAYASGTGMAQRARKALEQGVKSSLAAGPVSEISARVVAQAATEGDELARQLWQEAGQSLAIAIAGAASVLDLDRVVIGGGLIQAGDLLFGPLRQAWGKYAHLDFTRGLQIVPASLGQGSGVVGAAALALAEFGPNRPV